MAKLALLSLMAVFRDILPGYRIRPLTPAELQVTVTKEVQRMRDYEMALLKAFQAYLQLLRRIAGAASAPAAHQRCALLGGAAALPGALCDPLRDVHMRLLLCKGEVSMPS